MHTIASSVITVLTTLTALRLLVAAAGCNGTLIRASAVDVGKTPINDFSCENITKGHTREDWSTKVVALPKQHVFEADAFIAIDHYVKWPWYLKGIKLTVCNPGGQRPNVTWPQDGGYTPVEAHCVNERVRCPLGLDVFIFQYQSWWPS